MKTILTLLFSLALNALAQTTIHYQNHSASLEANILLYSTNGLVDVGAGIPPGYETGYTFNHVGPASLQVIDIFSLFEPAQIEVVLVPGQTIYVEITSIGNQLYLEEYKPKKAKKPKKDQ